MTISLIAQAIFVGLSFAVLVLVHRERRKLERRAEETVAVLTELTRQQEDLTRRQDSLYASLERLKEHPPEPFVDRLKREIEGSSRAGDAG